MLGLHLLRVKGPDVPVEAMGRMIDPFLLQDAADPGKWWCFYKQNGVSMSLSRDLKQWTYFGRTEAGENACILMDGDGPRKDDIFENKIAELWGQRAAFVRLMNLDVRLVHPAEGRKQSTETDWLTLGNAVKEVQLGVDHRPLKYFRAMIQAYAANQPQEFNDALSAYQEHLQRARPVEYHSARLEAFFNRFNPFVHCMVLYGLVFAQKAVDVLLVFFRLERLRDFGLRNLQPDSL